MQQDFDKYPRIGQTCCKCNEKVTNKKSRKDFVTILRKGSNEVYDCYCLSCLNAIDPGIIQTQISPQQRTKHPDQFVKQFKDSIDYPNEEQSKTTNYYVCQMQTGYQLMCKEHNEVLNLWNKKTSRLECIKCAISEDQIKFGENAHSFLDEEVKNVVHNIDKMIAQLDRAIIHYKKQQDTIQQAKAEQRKRDNQCKQDIEKFIEGDCKAGIDSYIKKKKSQLDKLDSKIGQYSDEIETRGRILRDRGNSIKQFASNFKEKNALYLKMEPMNFFKEDVNFWSNINKDWEAKSFNWSYRNPSFQFESPEKVAHDIFKVEHIKSEKDLRIVDFRHY